MTQDRPQEEYTEVDTPGKIKTLAIVKYGICGLIALLVFYGFAFDKWDLPADPASLAKELSPDSSVSGKSKKSRGKKSRK